MANEATLGEAWHEGYEPTDAQVEEYGKWLGMTLPGDEELLWIARQGLTAPLPSHWKACIHPQDGVYYFNFRTGESAWDHPLDAAYRELLAQEKRNLRRRAEAEAAGVGVEAPPLLVRVPSDDSTHTRTGGERAPLSNAARPSLLSNRGTAPLSNRGTAPLSNRGAAGLSNEGGARISSGKKPPLSSEAVEAAVVRAAQLDAVARQAAAREAEVREALLRAVAEREEAAREAAREAAKRAGVEEKAGGARGKAVYVAVLQRPLPEEGVGLAVSVEAGGVRVLSVDEGSPADRANLQEGDELLSANGVPLTRHNLADLLQPWDAAVSSVELRVRRLEAPPSPRPTSQPDCSSAKHTEPPHQQKAAPPALLSAEHEEKAPSSDPSPLVEPHPPSPKKEPAHVEACTPFPLSGSRPSHLIEPPPPSPWNGSRPPPHVEWSVALTPSHGAHSLNAALIAREMRGEPSTRAAALNARLVAEAMSDASDRPPSRALTPAALNARLVAEEMGALRLSPSSCYHHSSSDHAPAEHRYFTSEHHHVTPAHHRLAPEHPHLPSYPQHSSSGHDRLPSHHAHLPSTQLPSDELHLWRDGQLSPHPSSDHRALPLDHRLLPYHMREAEAIAVATSAIQQAVWARVQHDAAEAMEELSRLRAREEWERQQAVAARRAVAWREQARGSSRRREAAAGRLQAVARGGAVRRRAAAARRRRLADVVRRLEGCAALDEARAKLRAREEGGRGAEAAGGAANGGGGGGDTMWGEGGQRGEDEARGGKEGKGGAGEARGGGEGEEGAGEPRGGEKEKGEDEKGEEEATGREVGGGEMASVEEEMRVKESEAMGWVEARDGEAKAGGEVSGVNVARNGGGGVHEWQGEERAAAGLVEAAASPRAEAREDSRRILEWWRASVREQAAALAEGKAERWRLRHSRPRALRRAWTRWHAQSLTPSSDRHAARQRMQLAFRLLRAAPPLPTALPSTSRLRHALRQWTRLLSSPQPRPTLRLRLRLAFAAWASRWAAAATASAHASHTAAVLRPLPFLRAWRRWSSAAAAAARLARLAGQSLPLRARALHRWAAAAAAASAASSAFASASAFAFAARWRQWRATAAPLATPTAAPLRPLPSLRAWRRWASAAASAARLARLSDSSLPRLSRALHRWASAASSAAFSASASAAFSASASAFAFAARWRQWRAFAAARAAAAPLGWRAATGRRRAALRVWAAAAAAAAAARRGDAAAAAARASRGVRAWRVWAAARTERRRRVVRLRLEWGVRSWRQAAALQKSLDAWSEDLASPRGRGCLPRGYPYSPRGYDHASPRSYDVYSLRGYTAYSPRDASPRGYDHTSPRGYVHASSRRNDHASRETYSLSPHSGSVRLAPHRGCAPSEQLVNSSAGRHVRSPSPASQLLVQGRDLNQRKPAHSKSISVWRATSVRERALSEQSHARRKRAAQQYAECQAENARQEERRRQRIAARSWHPTDGACLLFDRIR
ncbi:hypothetical protein AB1Y20_004967 [Prymnesium parvum]|uniref:WW domain-containing protein n=1 Tax=Prymnesium parvum TaxID=97485 RepID=A0AB34J2T2_PRYPA